MRRKHLESALSSVRREFPDPKIELEQYPTSPLLTASVVLTALGHEDVGPGRSVLDLGCGTGMLALGCALVESDFVMGVDCDSEALHLAAENAVDMELDDRLCLVQAQVKSVSGINNSGAASNSHQQQQGNLKNRQQQSKHHRGGGRGKRGRVSGRGAGQNRKSTPAAAREQILSDDDGLPLRSKIVDTVLTNPPFGTKNNSGLDLRFLRTATRLARRAVYSFHKTTTRDFLVHTVTAWGMQIEVVAQMKFDLPKVYKFHKEKSVDVEVDLIRVGIPTAEQESSSPGVPTVPLSEPSYSLEDRTGE